MGKERQTQREREREKDTHSSLGHKVVLNPTNLSTFKLNPMRLTFPTYKTSRAQLPTITTTTTASTGGTANTAATTTTIYYYYYY